MLAPLMFPSKRRRACVAKVNVLIAASLSSLRALAERQEMKKPREARGFAGRRFQPEQVATQALTTCDVEERSRLKFFLCGAGRADAEVFGFVVRRHDQPRAFRAKQSTPWGSRTPVLGLRIRGKMNRPRGPSRRLLNALKTVAANDFAPLGDDYCWLLIAVEEHARAIVVAGEQMNDNAASAGKAKVEPAVFDDVADLQAVVPIGADGDAVRVEDHAGIVGDREKKRRRSGQLVSCTLYKRQDVALRVVLRTMHA